jgi:hypothetical protein
MDICLFIILLVVVLTFFVEFKEGFTRTPEYRNEYNSIAKSNNPIDLSKNTKRCYEYCSLAVPDSTQCNTSCDYINDKVAENIRMQSLIFGRYAHDNISLDSLNKS